VAGKEGNRGKDDGSYCFYGNDSIPGGWVHNWITDQKEDWFYAKGVRAMNEAERREREENYKPARAEARKERDEAQARAERSLNKTWEQASKAKGNHPYLKHKNAPAFGLRRDGEALIIPMYDKDGTLRNIQKIYGDGKKSFFQGARVRSLFHHIPAADGDDGTRILIATGYATSATCAQATGHETYVAFSDDNLLAVAWIVRERNPGKIIIICGDDDYKIVGADGKIYNPGTVKAQQAAAAIGALGIIPRFNRGGKNE
jgi:putative DNA primase/helicase